MNRATRFLLALVLLLGALVAGAPSAAADPWQSCRYQAFSVGSWWNVTENNYWYARGMGIPTRVNCIR